MSGSYQEATLKIDKKVNPEIFRSASDPTIIFSNLPIEIPYLNYYSTPIDIEIKERGKPLKFVFRLISLISFFTSLRDSLVFIKLLQLLDFLTFIDVDVPSNVQALYYLLESDIFGFIPNLFEKDEKKLKINLHPKFVENDLDYLMINNMGSNLEFLTIGLLTKGITHLIFRFLQFCFKNSPKKNDKKNGFCFSSGVNLAKFFCYLNSELRMHRFLGFFLAIQVDVFMAFSISLYYLQFSFLKHWLSLVLYLALLLLYAIIFAIFGYLTFGHYIKD